MPNSEQTPNATRQAPLEAAATQEQRLEGVGCRRLFGPAPAPGDLEKCLTPLFLPVAPTAPAPDVAHASAARRPGPPARPAHPPPQGPGLLDERLAAYCAVP